jgi:hypothetical protein
MKPIFQISAGRFAALFATLVITVASLPAHAEYRCAAPQFAAERHACDLAKLDRPDPLYRYIQRTRASYNLYMPDYVSERDVERWEKARAKDERHEHTTDVANAAAR